ncbi:ADP ribosylation factor [Echinococcus multilocularis]|uniref:ADP ribosylation factor n=1 Tax=Echinococcus multilocularis TaxID=6211 RepID=A0A087W2A4_ECHMU|nr:ADP ribosylation factor [Echinococcus multilocularis]
MDDAHLFASERLKTSMCASQYFNAKELPECPELCVDMAISWATQSPSPSLSILAQRFLRTALSLSSYERMVTGKILGRIEGCEPAILLALLTDSLPRKSFLENLNSRWTFIRTGLEDLVKNWVSSQTPQGAFKIQDILKCWRRGLKALALNEEDSSPLLSQLLNETCLLLINTIDKKLPSNLAYSLIRLLQKMIEIVYYDNWSFALKPQASRLVNNSMRTELLSLASNIDLTCWVSHNRDENLFDFNIRCYRLLLYTMARLLFAQGCYQSSIMDRLAISDKDLIAIFQSDDVLLFRMLLTLLLIENDAVKNGWIDKLKVPSAHYLFTSLLELIGFDRYCLIEWLVSPETDCLAYLLAYTKRLAASSINNDDEGQQQRWCLPTCWLQQHGEGVRQLMASLAKSLQTLHINSSLPFSPDLLITRIDTAVKVLTSV